ncbi:MAG: hypothetical protein GYA02_10000 [Clostridiaceae bacterium]|nr:hypothetical protein [Clostridiaceae bacterium]
MKLEKLIQILDAELLNEKDCNIDIEVNTACGSDLMSDVISYGDEKDVLLSGLVNPQVIRTAEMMDIKVVIFVRGKRPTEAMIELASEKGIVLITTKNPMFSACGKLYNAGISGGSV